MSATCIPCQPLPRPEIRRIWKEYQLEPRTRFNTRVTSVKRKPGTGEHIKDDPAHSQSSWIINNGEDGEFDAVIVTVGTCGEPNMVKMKGMPGWKDEKKSTHEEKIERSKSPDGASAKANSVASERDRISFGGI